MKKNDLRRCKIREIPSHLRKRLADGTELIWEVNIPAGLNHGNRYRTAFPTKKEAQAALDNKVNGILNNGTEKALTSQEVDLYHRVKAKANKANIPEEELESLVDKAISQKKQDGNNFLVSALFKYYLDNIQMGDGIKYGSIRDYKEAEAMFLKKWGDMRLCDVKKEHAQGLLMLPPDTEDGDTRIWSTSSRKTMRSRYSAVWNFGLNYWTDNDGKSFVPWNPFSVLWFGKRRGKPGLAAVYDDVEFLKAVYQKFGTYRSDMLPGWEVDLKAGLRPMSELAGGRSQKEIEFNMQEPLTWGQVKLSGEKFGCGYIDTWCHKTFAEGVQRRLVPLRRSSQQLLALYKPHFNDSDPILPGSASAYYQVLARIFEEVGMELYGKPRALGGPKGERDMRRHTALSVFMNETDENGNNRNSLDEVAKWAGHENTRMLFAYYFGAMTGETANAIANLGMPKGWLPSLKKVGPGSLWNVEEAKVARVWGMHNSPNKSGPKPGLKREQVVIHDEVLSTLATEANAANHDSKHENHGSTINQAPSRHEIEC